MGSEKTIGGFVALSLILWGINYLWVIWFNNPIIYCMGIKIASPFAALFEIGLLFLVIGTSVAFYNGGFKGGINMVVTTTIYVGIPYFFQTIFFIGGKCS